MYFISEEKFDGNENFVGFQLYMYLLKVTFRGGP